MVLKEGYWKGKKFSEEHKKNISEARKELIKDGKLKVNFVNGHKINIGRKREPFSEEWKKNIGLAHLGKKSPQQSIRMKLKNPMYSQDLKDKLSSRVRGEKNFFWNGGKSKEPYDENFSDKFKREIRKRDNQICMNCGIHKEQLKRALDIHHINYDKKLSIPENCISLCIRCHTLTQKNRKYWVELFQDKLSKIYGYKYSDNQIILNISGGKNE